MFTVLWLAALCSAAPLDDLLDPVFPPDVLADEPVTGPEVRTDHGGALVLRHTEIVAQIQAGLARITLVQQFQNPYDEVLEATYLLPLPDDAAVDRMDLTVGDRLIEGWIMERGEARAVYEQAVEEGRKAALFEQERENLFEQSISGLCPGENVAITIQYTVQLDLEDGVYQLALPTTVGERYDTPMMDDPGDVWTPYSATGQALDITVYIDEGLPVESLWSDSKSIEVMAEGTWGAEVRLDPADARPDSDFHLAWSLAGEQPRAAVVTHRPSADEDGYLALTVEPQLLGDHYEAQRRELLFVIDSSCSMRGRPYDTATETVLRAVDTMREGDTFNLVRFASAASSLFPEPMPVNATTRASAAQWLARFEGGGTNMDAGIVHSLDMPGDPEALRLVLLLTDGFISGEKPMFEVVRQHLGRSRLFALGVGSSVNRYLLEGLAEMGRGDVIYQLPHTPIDETVRTFHDRIAHPGMTDIVVDWGDLDVTEQFPTRIPDLWAGQPLRVVARFSEGGDTEVTVRGRVGGGEVSLRVPVTVPDRELDHEAVAQLWARRKIREIEWYPGERDASEVRAEVIDVALAHHLVSSYTSLVAVDDEECACGTPALSIQVPHQRPQGTAGGLGGLGGLGTSGYGSGASGHGYGSGVVSGLSSGQMGQLTTRTVRQGATDASLGKSAGMAGSFGGGVMRPSALPVSRPPRVAASVSWHGGEADLSGAAVPRASVAAPASRRGGPVVSGTIDRSLIDAVIKRHLPRLTGEYERRLRTDRALSGKLVVRFVIDANGDVLKAEVVTNTTGSAAFADAIAERFAAMTFPQPPGGGEVIVNYPLVFNPK